METLRDSIYKYIGKGVNRVEVKDDAKSAKIK
jgi:hypothetical protein